MPALPRREPETPPLMVRWFGKDWENLDGKPDVLDWLFGEQGNAEIAAEQKTPSTTPSTTLTSRPAAKELDDPYYIKQVLDTELVRYVCEDLGHEEDHALFWKQTVLVFLSVVLAVVAQFPSYYPFAIMTQEVRYFDMALIGLSVVCGGACWLLASPFAGLPRNLLLKTRQGAVMVSTDFAPHRSLDYLVTVSSSPSKTIAIPVTDLFTPTAVLCPQRLHSVLQDLLS